MPSIHYQMRMLSLTAFPQCVITLLFSHF
jgi:hypothetical protein